VLLRDTIVNITKKKLQKIIKEEMSAVLKEVTLKSLGEWLAKRFKGGYFTGGFGKSGTTHRNTTEFGSDNYVWFYEDSDRDTAWKNLSSDADALDLGELDGQAAIEYKGAVLLKTTFYEMGDPVPAIALVSKRKKWYRDANADRH
jgi:hypothetical protein